MVADSVADHVGHRPGDTVVMGFALPSGNAQGLFVHGMVTNVANDGAVRGLYLMQFMPLALVLAFHLRNVGDLLPGLHDGNRLYWYG